MFDNLTLAELLDMDTSKMGREELLTHSQAVLRRQNNGSRSTRNRIEDLERRLQKLEAMMGARSGDMFDASDLADLIREDEPHAEAQRRWRLQYTQLNNRLVDTRLPPLTDAERALLNRLQRALYAGRHGAVETI
jgi:hypothetical protein